MRRVLQPAAAAAAAEAGKFQTKHSFGAEEQLRRHIIQAYDSPQASSAVARTPSLEPASVWLLRTLERCEYAYDPEAEGAVAAVVPVLGLAPPLTHLSVLVQLLPALRRRRRRSGRQTRTSWTPTAAASPAAVSPPPPPATTAPSRHALRAAAEPGCGVAGGRTEVQECFKAIGVPPIPSSLAKILPGRYPKIRYRIMRKSSIRTGGSPPHCSTTCRRRLSLTTTVAPHADGICLCPPLQHQNMQKASVFGRMQGSTRTGSVSLSPTALPPPHLHLHLRCLSPPRTWPFRRPGSLLKRAPAPPLLCL